MHCTRSFPSLAVSHVGQLRGFRETSIQTGYFFGSGEIFTNLCKVSKCATLPFVQQYGKKVPLMVVWSTGLRVEFHSPFGRCF